MYSKFLNILYNNCWHVRNPRLWLIAESTLDVSLSNQQERCILCEICMFW